MLHGPAGQHQQPGRVSPLRRPLPRLRHRRAAQLHRTSPRRRRGRGEPGYIEICRMQNVDCRPTRVSRWESPCPTSASPWRAAAWWTACGGWWAPRRSAGTAWRASCAASPTAAGGEASRPASGPWIQCSLVSFCECDCHNLLRFTAPLSSPTREEHPWLFSDQVPRCSIHNIDLFCAISVSLCLHRHPGLRGL